MIVVISWWVCHVDRGRMYFQLLVSNLILYAYTILSYLGVQFDTLDLYCFHKAVAITSL
jgi:hypothetical protein